MVHDADLDAAVHEGIVSQAQADALRTLAAGRRQQHATVRRDEERFRFMRGFNDVFFAVGILLFGFGLGFFAGSGALGNLLAAAIIWTLAELLVRRMRLVLPGILLACFFVFFTFRMVQIDWDVIAQISGFRPPQATTRQFSGPYFQYIDPLTILIKSAVTSVMALAFYARFRLPFTLLLIAGSLVIVAQALIGLLFPNSSLVQSIVYLLCGLGVFVAAMTYDLRDRERATRRTDCAFWLHLLAAPLIVHSLIAMISPLSLRAGVDITIETAATVVIIVSILTYIAVIIDRRALFVSALSYLGIVIGYAITASGTAPADRSVVFFSTLLILGVTVLVLAVGWQPLRRVVMYLLPTALASRLPSVVPAR